MRAQQRLNARRRERGPHQAGMHNRAFEINDLQPLHFRGARHQDRPREFPSRLQLPHRQNSRRGFMVTRCVLEK